ncbi:MAG: hypothetical protein QOI80_470 [Solirubrobacteraceae bacterium]|nr:hypothetical protein [Solirubrobacteraceae bacterium]
MKSKYTEKFKTGAAPYLEPGEEVLTAFIAQAKGRTQAVASGTNLIAKELGSRKMGKVADAAQDAGLVVGNPMALAISNQRILTFKISTPILGRGGDIKELLSAVPLHAVQDVTVKRFGMAKRITITINNSEVQLESAAGADEFLAAYQQAKA